jgi:heptosyltransferase-1
LFVKLSSLGDVVHTLPAAADIKQMISQAEIDWVVEPAFMPLVQASGLVDRVVPCALRKWMHQLTSASTWQEISAFKRLLQQVNYDCVIDFQGLTKSALISRLAHISSHGRRIAMANQTDGSSYEAPTRWLASQVLKMPQHIHAVDRARLLAAQALNYPLPNHFNPGLRHYRSNQKQLKPASEVALIHGTSRDDKLWAFDHWVTLGKRLAEQSYTIGLPHGNDEELQRSLQLAQAIGEQASVWPRLPIDQLTLRLAGCVAAIGVDSGLSHIAAALDLPHVQIYNFDTAWRTGPQSQAHQWCVFANPMPGIDQVWQAWLQCRSASQ